MPGIHLDKKDLFGEDFSRYGTEILMSWAKVAQNLNEIKKILHIVRLGQLDDSSDRARLSWSLPTSVSSLSVKYSCQFELNIRGINMYSADMHLNWHLAWVCRVYSTMTHSMLPLGCL